MSTKRSLSEKPSVLLFLTKYETSNGGFTCEVILTDGEGIVEKTEPLVQQSN